MFTAEIHHHSFCTTLTAPAELFDSRDLAGSQAGSSVCFRESLTHASFLTNRRPARKFADNVGEVRADPLAGMQILTELFHRDELLVDERMFLWFQANSVYENHTESLPMLSYGNVSI